MFDIPRIFPRCPCSCGPAFPCQWTRCARFDRRILMPSTCRWVRTPLSTRAPCDGSECAGKRHAQRPKVGPAIRRKKHISYWYVDSHGILGHPKFLLRGDFTSLRLHLILFFEPSKKASRTEKLYVSVTLAEGDADTAFCQLHVPQQLSNVRYVLCTLWSNLHYLPVLLSNISEASHLFTLPVLL